MANLSFIAVRNLANLLETADPKKNKYLRVLNSTQLVLGADPLQPDTIINLSNETVTPFQDGVPQATDSVTYHDNSRASRRSGEYWFEIHGKRNESSSLRNLLADALKALEKSRKGTWDNLSLLKGRSRRIVARNPAHLFDKPHLVKEYAAPLADGWYFGTNNSARETNVWLYRAAECAGLEPGKTFKTSLG